MKRFWHTLKFELKNYFSDKIIIGITIFLFVIITLMMIAPFLLKNLNGKLPTFGEKEEPLPILLSGEIAPSLKESFSAAFEGHEIQVVQESREEIEKQVQEDKVSGAFVFENATKYQYYVKERTLNDQNTEIANRLLKNYHYIETMKQHGVSPDVVKEALSVQINGELIPLGKDQIKSFGYAYMMVMALYIVILAYGQMIATSVANEKSSRAMEVLITSTKPIYMMLGKVFAACTAGATQLIVLFGWAAFLYNLMRSYHQDNPIFATLFDIPMNILVYMVVFFILGFLVYAFLFSAMGSLISKIEDMGTITMPVILIFLIGFFVSINAMTSGNVDSMFVKVFSYLPFSSPMVMFTRVAMSTVPMVEIAASIGILMLTCLIISVLSAKIYRMGVLLYGTPPKFLKILKMLSKK